MTLTEGKVRAIANVLVINKDSADLMIKRNVDPMDVMKIADLACGAIRAGRVPFDRERLRKLVWDALGGFPSDNAEEFNIDQETVDRIIDAVVG